MSQRGIAHARQLVRHARHRLNGYFRSNGYPVFFLPACLAVLGSMSDYVMICSSDMYGLGTHQARYPCSRCRIARQGWRLGAAGYARVTGTWMGVRFRRQRLFVVSVHLELALPFPLFKWDQAYLNARNKRASSKDKLQQDSKRAHGAEGERGQRGQRGRRG